MVFVKKGAPKIAESGTRPGLSGQTLVSTGLADFDKLLGGGLPLGTVTLLLEDTFTQHHVTLLRYFLAEGAAHSHALYWAAGQSQTRTLPQKVTHIPKEEAKQKQQEAEEVQLRIAWQYRRYIRSKQKAAAASTSGVSRSAAGGSKARSSSSSSAGIREWCHNFDLTKLVPVQDLQLTRLDSPVIHGSNAAHSLIQSSQAFVGSLADRTPTAAPPSAPIPATIQDGEAANNTGSTVTGDSSHVPMSAQSVHMSHPQLHTFDAAQSHAALQRLKLSNDATASTSAQGAPVSKTYSNAQQLLAGTAAAHQTAAVDPALSHAASWQANSDGMDLAEHAEAPHATSAFSPISAEGLASAAQRQMQHRVGRVGVQSLGGLDWGLESFDQETERQLFMAMVQLKALMRGSRCAAMVSFPAGLYSRSLTTRLIHLCDTVVALEAVRDDSDIVRLIPDAASCCGLLHLQKLPSLNALGPPLPGVTLFLIRHKRKRIAIQAVQTDPDAEAAEADGKAVAASLCGGPPKADKPFDF